MRGKRHELARCHLLGWQRNTGHCVLLHDVTRPVHSHQKEIDVNMRKKHIFLLCDLLQLLRTCGDETESFRAESEKPVWRHCVPGFSGGRRRVAACLVYFTTSRGAATRHTAASVPVAALRRPPQVRLPPDSIGPFRRRQNIRPHSKPLKKHAEKKPSGAHSQV